VQSSHGGKCMRFSPPLGEAGARQMYCTEYGRTKELAMRKCVVRKKEVVLSRVILVVCPFVVLIRRSGRFLFLSGGVYFLSFVGIANCFSS